jgi:DNA (cytosine-5)-methyltransferase 1
MMNKVLRVFETFAGYGGASFGLKKAKIKHKVIGFSEFDKYADIIFSKNHPNIKNYWDITKVDTKSLPNFDLFTGGFPCQPFSTAGSGLGEMDIRGTLFYEIIRICGDKQPRDILLENVKGITMGKHKQTFQKILLELENIGYQVHYKILNSKDFGIPQNRERVWIYATKNTRDVFWKFDLKPFKLKLFFKDFLEENPDENLYLNQEQIKRLIELHNVNLNVKEPCCLDIYNKKVRTDGISITLTEPHHNSLRVVEPKRKGKFVVRKLSVLEHFRLMGFKDNEIDFAELSYQQLCKRAGNGWDINVASRIFKKIYE